MKTPSEACFVGHDGNSVLLEPSRSYNDDDPLVQAHPDLFVDVEPVVAPRRGPGRPKGSLNKPNPAPSRD